MEKQNSLIKIDAPVGSVSLNSNKEGCSFVIVASGQSEDHLSWYYDVYRARVLERAAKNFEQCRNGKKFRSPWNESYLDFMKKAGELLLGLAEEKKAALITNRLRLGEARAIGAYESRKKAEMAALWIAKKYEPTLNAGWLNVHVIEIPR